MKPKNKKIKLKRIKESITEIEFVEDIKVEKRVLGMLNGKRVGRPLKLTENQIFQAIKLKHSQSSKQVANRFGVGRSTLYRHIAKYKEAS
jgi:transcriptional regulator with PAS, ATPase and Fis domain